MWKRPLGREEEIYGEEEGGDLWGRVELIYGRGEEIFGAGRNVDGGVIAEGFGQQVCEHWLVASAALYL